MCGINGYMQYNSELSSEQIYSLIGLMNKEIVHRGPDDDGVFIHSNAGLGMRRLSIIDLATGKQPIYNERKDLVIVCNGEIYNYISLKRDLLQKGHVFSTATDTEVILHCFEEYGTNGINLLKGMFAFAIYDIENNKLILARDRVGEKPLYYFKDENKILFASELKSMLSTGIIRRAICKKALHQYLQLTYISAPLTIFESIYKLLPGHYIEVDSNGTLNMQQYWDICYRESELITDYEQCKAELRSTLFNAVEECMVADVPIGAFLSGGIDSTTIVGIMSRISPKPIDTFTIGYKNKAYDESERARAAALMHNTNHHIHYLEYNDALPELDKMLNNIDEPFGDSSYIPTYMVSKYSKQFVKTVLTGDAGDELFGGYNKYLIGYYSEKYSKIPKWVREEIIKKAVYSLPDKSSLSRKVRKVIKNADKDIYEQRINLMCLGFQSEELVPLLNTNWYDSGSLDFIYEYYIRDDDFQNELSRVLYTDLKVVLEGDMLAKVDRASMLTSLETRVPMLHKDVIELAARIPSQYKIDLNNTKIILKETFADLIPKQLLNAKKKGFGVPIGSWFRDELRDDLVDSLNIESIRSQGIFNYEYLRQILDEHLSFRKNRSNELWLLYVFQKWYKNYYLA